MTRHFLILTLSLLFAAMMPANAYSQYDVMSEVRKHASPDIPQEDFKAITERILKIGESGTAKEMAAELDLVEKNWGVQGGENYASAFLTGITYLTSSRFIRITPDLQEIRDKYLLVALSHSDTYSLLMETRMLPLLNMYSRNKVLDEKDVQSRKNTMRLWLQAIRRLEAEIDPNFDEPKSRAKMNVMPPLGADGPAYAGMPPDDIKDPVKRAAYEKAIDENRIRFEYWTLQGHLYLAQYNLRSLSSLYAATAYAKPPAAPGELTELLAQSGISAEHRKWIEDAIKPSNAEVKDVKVTKN